jgi:hypothetical protein
VDPEVGKPQIGPPNPHKWQVGKVHSPVHSCPNAMACRPFASATESIRGRPIRAISAGRIGGALRHHTTGPSLAPSGLARAFLSGYRGTAMDACHIEQWRVRSKELRTEAKRLTTLKQPT